MGYSRIEGWALAFVALAGCGQHSAESIDQPQSGGDAATGGAGDAGDPPPIDAAPPRSPDAAPADAAPALACAIEPVLGDLGLIEATSATAGIQSSASAVLTFEQGLPPDQLIVGLQSGQPPFGGVAGPLPVTPGIYPVAAPDVLACGVCLFLAGDAQPQGLPAELYVPVAAQLEVTSVVDRFTGKVAPLPGGPPTVTFDGFDVSLDPAGAPVFTPNGCTVTLASASFDAALPAP